MHLNRIQKVPSANLAWLQIISTDGSRYCPRVFSRILSEYSYTGRSKSPLTVCN